MKMFVSGKIHADMAATRNGRDLAGEINWWVRRIYLALIFGVVGAMFVHNALLFHKKVAAHLRASGRPVLRMSLSQRWQHAVLALSFITLAVTGIRIEISRFGAGGNAGFERAVSPLDPSHRRHRAAADRALSPDSHFDDQGRPAGW